MNTHKPIGHSRLRSPHYKFSLFSTQWWRRRRRRRLHTKHMNLLYDQTLEIASLISTLFSSLALSLSPSLWGRVVVSTFIENENCIRYAFSEHAEAAYYARLTDASYIFRDRDDLIGRLFLIFQTFSRCLHFCRRCALFDETLTVIIT